MTIKPHPKLDDTVCLVCEYYALGDAIRYIKKRRDELKEQLKRRDVSLTQLKKEDEQ